MPWFMANIEKGQFTIVNPFNRRESVVPATPDHVHSIVFWSKDFGRFINGGFGQQLQKKGYNLFFNFTINSDAPLLEPRVPPLTERLEQLGELCRRFTPAAINWRFDPICYFRSGGEKIHNNLEGFGRIAEKAAGLGVRRCITSFMDDYPKIRKRVGRLPDFSFVDPPLEEKIAQILGMHTKLAQKGMRLLTCCEKELQEALPDDSEIAPSSCIPNDLLVQLYGGGISLKRDRGQRVAAGCGCRESTDIGSYQQQPCYHNCLFCYANPRPGTQENNTNSVFKSI
jgi:hypothetical protein